MKFLTHVLTSGVTSKCESTLVTKVGQIFRIGTVRYAEGL